jgi:hypothetical protein
MPHSHGTTCTLKIPIISQKKSLADLNSRDQGGRCRPRSCDWLHKQDRWNLHSRGGATEKQGAVDVTRHRICCAKYCEPRRTTWCVVESRWNGRATNTNASLEGIIWLQSISASQFGEADKRPGVLQEAVCLTFAVVPVGANRTACQGKRGPVIRRFTSGTLEVFVTLRDSG